MADDILTKDRNGALIAARARRRRRQRQFITLHLLTH